MSKIEPIAGLWDAETAAIDAVDRIRGEEDGKVVAFLAIWITEDGSLSYSKTEFTLSQAAMFATQAQSIAMKIFD